MTENRAPIALICAMESEQRHALDSLDERVDLALGPWLAAQGTINQQPVVVLATGIGLVNAAAATAVLLSVVRPRAVINFGCAGAHHEHIYPGDVVIGSEVVAYGSLISLPDGAERYVGFRYRKNGETFLADTLRADRRLLTFAREAAVGWAPERWPFDEVDRERTATVHVGVIGSADCWTQDPRRIGVLHDRHKTLCEEMEAAAIAQVCAIHDVPMLAIKDISNNELHNATELGAAGPTLADVSAELGARSFALVQRMLVTLNV